LQCLNVELQGLELEHAGVRGACFRSHGRCVGFTR
jgi:hypothetical protein